MGVDREKDVGGIGRVKGLAHEKTLITSHYNGWRPFPTEQKRWYIYCVYIVYILAAAKLTRHGG